mgnify:CR=1 FL=1
MMIDLEKIYCIEEPLMNCYCEKCENLDGDEPGFQYCKANHYLNCGQIIECCKYREKENNDQI